jgi:hypothetical protein
LHWKVEPALSALNANEALVEFVFAVGLDVIVTTGAVVSIVQVVEAMSLTFPAVSVARTWKVCVPAARPVSETGLEHDAKAAPSSLHSNVEPLFELLKLKLALVEFVVAAGFAVKVTTGAVVSIVQL